MNTEQQGYAASLSLFSSLQISVGRSRTNISRCSSWSLFRLGLACR